MIDGKAMAAKAREMADQKRADSKARWEAKLANCEKAREARVEAEALLRPILADFVAASPGMVFDAENLRFYIGACHVADVYVFGVPATLCLVILPQWPSDNLWKDEDFKCKDIGEFKEVFAREMSRFF